MIVIIGKKTIIMVVDDDADIRQMLSIILENEGYEIITANNGQHAIDILDDSIDLMLLDVMMPKKDGISTCIDIRKSSNVPIIFLTSKESEMDQLTGLSVGADDYVLKPFKPALLLARIRLVIRRSKINANDDKAQTLKLRNLELNSTNHIVTIDKNNIKLTPTEFYILELLIKNQGRVFSIEQIYNLIWDEPYLRSSSNTVMVHIRKLREKLEDDSSNPEYLKTEWGVGYKIE